MFDNGGRMLGRRKNQVVVEAKAFSIPDHLFGHRQCQGEVTDAPGVTCNRNATMMVFKFTGVKGQLLADSSSRRFACSDHATLALWPKRVHAEGLGRRWRGGQHVGAKGDQYDFYRTMVKKMGGEVPVPNYKPDKVRVKTCWPDRVIATTLRFVMAHDRHFRPKGMSGRQWKMYRRANGLSSDSR
jgi:hypothetical protein